MCEIKTVLIVAALLLTATGFCTNQVNSEKKVGHHSEIKSESPCEKEYIKHCSDGGDCCYQDDEDIVARNCTWLYGRNVVKSTCGGLGRIVQKLTRCKEADSKSDETKKFRFKICQG